MEYPQLKSALTANIHAQTIAERDYHQAQTEADKWEKRYQLSLKEGREDLVRESRFRKDVHTKTACNLKTLLNEQTERLATLRRNLAAHSKTLTNKSSTDSGFKPLETPSQAMAELPGSVGTRLLVERELEAMTQLLHQQEGVGKLLQQNSTILENVKTLLVEASSNVTSEPNSTELETQCLTIESDNEIDDDLAALRIRVCYSAISQNPTQLPTSDTFSQIAELDDLETLLSQIDKL